MADSKRVHAFDDDVLAHHDATALVALLKNGDLSAAEVTDAVIRRIEAVNPALGALVYADFDNARARAAAGEQHSGFYAGLPTLIKDNIMVRGMPTANGMLHLHAKPAAKDSHVTRQFRKLGFNILGKSQLSELGLSPNAIFKDGSAVHNPWHTDYTSGASSAGAGALVASGALPIAHGNDGGGSIRIPAACCGLVGLKGTRGRLAKSEASRSMPIDVVCEGVLTRTVRDTANFFAAAEQVYRNPKLPPIGKVTGPGKPRLRIGFLIDSITPEPTDAATRTTIEKTADLLAGLGHHVEAATMPAVDGFDQDFLLYYALLFFCQTQFGTTLVDPSFDKLEVDGLTRGFARNFQKSWYKLPATLHGLHKKTRIFRKKFTQYDAVLTPVLTRTTPKIDYLDPNQPFEQLLHRLMCYVGFTPMNNAAGAPGISLPMGQTDNGLPIGIQLSSELGQERMLLELAFELEQAQPWPLIDSAMKQS